MDFRSIDCNDCSKCPFVADNAQQNTSRVSEYIFKETFHVAHTVLNDSTEILSTLAKNLLKKGAIEQVKVMVQTLPYPSLKLNIHVQLINELIRKEPHGDYQNLIDEALNLIDNLNSSDAASDKFEFLFEMAKRQIDTNPTQATKTAEKLLYYYKNKGGVPDCYRLTKAVEIMAQMGHIKDALHYAKKIRHVDYKARSFIHCLRAYAKINPPRAVCKAKKYFNPVKPHKYFLEAVLPSSLIESSSPCADPDIYSYKLRTYLCDALIEIAKVQMEKNPEYASNLLLEARGITAENAETELQIFFLLCKVNPKAAIEKAHSLINSTSCIEELFASLAQLNRYFALALVLDLLRSSRKARALYSIALHCLDDKKFAALVLENAHGEVLNIKDDFQQLKMLYKISKLRVKLNIISKTSDMRFNDIICYSYGDYMKKGIFYRKIYKLFSKYHPGDQNLIDLKTAAINQLRHSFKFISADIDLMQKQLKVNYAFNSFSVEINEEEHSMLTEHAVRIVKKIYLLSRDRGIECANSFKEPIKSIILHELVKLNIDKNFGEAITLANMMAPNLKYRGLAFAYIMGSNNASALLLGGSFLFSKNNNLL